MTKTTPWREIRPKLDAAAEARVESIKQAMRDANTLAQLRESLGLRQVEVAERLGTNQGGVSRLERREDLYLSTLREYVVALGGELELLASFPDGRRVRIESIEATSDRILRDVARGRERVPAG
jgi:transcriptional regulator with XRE-family HTH domain